MLKVIYFVALFMSLMAGDIFLIFTNIFEEFTNKEIQFIIICTENEKYSNTFFMKR